MTMTKTYMLGAALVLMLGANAALAASGEYQNLDPTALADGKGMRTKCEVSTLVEGRTYCFVNEENKTRFMKDPVVMRQKAETFYASKANDPNWKPCDYNDDYKVGNCE
jgi:YHS domain-containing protein